VQAMYGVLAVALVVIAERDVSFHDCIDWKCREDKAYARFTARTARIYRYGPARWALYGRIPNGHSRKPTFPGRDSEMMAAAGPCHDRRPVNELEA